MGNKEFEHKIIRDPIHSYVCISEKESSLIDTPAFQRLRRIKQLANSHLVYPSAVHSRFEHSLGVLEIAYRIANRIDCICDDSDKIKAIRYAALLHDIGHGPFSHVFEDILNRTNNLDTARAHELPQHIGSLLAFGSSLTGYRYHIYMVGRTHEPLIIGSRI